MKSVGSGKIHLGILKEVAKERTINNYLWDFKDDREYPRGLENGKCTVHPYSGRKEAFEGVMSAG